MSFYIPGYLVARPAGNHLSPRDQLPKDFHALFYG
jgi:hypothetical protein